MRRTFLVAALALLAGCSTPPAGDEGRDEPEVLSLDAPWWEIGDAWTLTFELAGRPARTTTLVNFANDSFGDPPHFWLGVADRDEALEHVFFETNPFLGRIHWEILAPHEKGMHSAMYDWPLRDGHRWTSPILLGKEDLAVEATRRADGTFAIEGEARKDGSRFAYDYDPAVEWFRELAITGPDGRVLLQARVDERTTGERGTFHFLRGRDYLDAKGGSTGMTESFTVKEEGATSIAFLLDIVTTGPSALEFVDPTGAVFHRETLPLGGTSDKVVEVGKRPPPGDWTLRYVGSVSGDIKVRGILAYEATI